MPPEFYFSCHLGEEEPFPLPGHFHVACSPCQKRQYLRHALLRETCQRHRNAHGADDLIPLADGDSNCTHSLLSVANCTAVTETCNGVEFPVQRLGLALL